MYRYSSGIHWIVDIANMDLDCIVHKLISMCIAYRWNMIDEISSISGHHI